jgi:hypothetical protein
MHSVLNQERRSPGRMAYVVRPVCTRRSGMTQRSVHTSLLNESYPGQGSYHFLAQVG